MSFARSCSTRPSQRSKYTEGVALRMRICIAVQRLSRKCVQKKIRPVRLVRFQPDHFSPHPWLAWRRQIGPMLGKRPWHAHSAVTCCNIIRDGCEQCERPSLPTISVLPTERSAKGVACEISERSERGGCLFTQSHADHVIGLQDERSLMNLANVSDIICACERQEQRVLLDR